MRLIDADAINVKRWFAFPDNRKTMAEALAEAHTIDAVPVVRCKDCEHWKPCDEKSMFAGHMYCEWAGWLVGGEAYCAYGEVKNDD